MRERKMFDRRTDAAISAARVREGSCLLEVSQVGCKLPLSEHSSATEEQIEPSLKLQFVRLALFATVCLPGLAVRRC